MKTPTLLLLAAVAALGAFAPVPLLGGGTLTPIGSTAAPIQIRDHQVNVVLTHGFAQTEVVQTFFNPNPTALEARYAFPVPKSASLSEVNIVAGEKTLNGEVMPKAEAEALYERERQQGTTAGLASKNGFQTFEFRVSPVPANAEVRLRFVYYQPLEIDTGVGRYVYPQEDGGTDEQAAGFWTANAKVEGNFGIAVELKSSVPVADVRAPGHEGAAQVQRLGDGHLKVTLDRAGGSLTRDFVLYYRLADNLPGRVDVIPYRSAPDKPGTFMMVVTPGLDLKPLTAGADTVFVLDASGSMQTKLHTLAEGVSQALGKLRPEDRFRIVVFNQRARELVPLQPATAANVQAAIAAVHALKADRSTNLFAGIQEGLASLDADRATSLVLVTDGVANEGVVNPAAFHRLLKQHDLRVFGFLMGNSANWPLMRTMADATGGFYTGVSNDDDIVGQLLLAKSKLTHESLHDASFRFTGVRVFDTTGDLPQKIHRGEQLVLFGRYEKAGRATVTLRARLTGEDRTYTATFDFPEVDTANPEIERLWALAQIEQADVREASGALPAEETRSLIRDLGVAYQLVTDHTTMVVLDDDAFTRNGISRTNADRVARERQAQGVRAGQPVANHRVDAAQPAFSAPAPHVAHGGGALDPVKVNLMLLAFIVGGSAFVRGRLGSGKR